LGWGFNQFHLSDSHNESLLRISYKYSDQGEAAWFVAMNVQGDSSGLPVCLQKSENAADRALDLLSRYKNWTADSQLDNIINTLEPSNSPVNKTVTSNEFTTVKLTWINSRLYDSFYWKFNINGTDDGGIGITFLDNLVLFRDDRNMPSSFEAPVSAIGAAIPSTDGTINLLLYPKPNSVGVSTSSNISLQTNPTYSSFDLPEHQDPLGNNHLAGTYQVENEVPVEIVKLYLAENNEENNMISLVPVRESDNCTFYLPKPLKPDTFYTATLIYGQETPYKMDAVTLSMYSWNFTTSNTEAEKSNFPSPRENITSEANLALPSSTTIRQTSSDRTGLDWLSSGYLMVIISVLAIAVFVAVLLIKRRSVLLKD
jgi:hypothetical protein